MRTNTYKQKILELLGQSHLLSIADLHAALPEADYSTIYRNVEQLCAEGLIKQVVLDKDCVQYELNQSEHQHDHFLCTSCGDVGEVEKSDITIKSLDNCLITEVICKGLCQKCH